ncbi:hypothetical protein CBOM_00304 [Ceraceosorus bombacis]|uniref:Uncharacterized protein n=1 Tax=Ceraceosorus bombacis TaxID=401625 RepID=A0A0P1BAB5_9BASI|nr:hypothetical protein CBOM_00304 [Ceraceosorus bombacis]
MTFMGVLLACSLAKNPTLQSFFFHSLAPLIWWLRNATSSPSHAGHCSSLKGSKPPTFFEQVQRSRAKFGIVASVQGYACSSAEYAASQHIQKRKTKIHVTSRRMEGGNQDDMRYGADGRPKREGNCAGSKQPSSARLGSGA